MDIHLYIVVLSIALFKFSMPRVNITNSTDLTIRDIYIFEM